MSLAKQQDIRIETLDLPAEGIAAARPDGAAILALAARDRDGRLAGLIAARARRTAAVMRVTALSAGDHAGPALAMALLAAARNAGMLAVRAADDLPHAADLLDLAPTGRGYAQRWLAPTPPVTGDVGAFNQTTGFTCGPVSLAMALGREVTRHDEIAIWREATTVIGLTGPGGCDPYGLALAAWRRAGPVTLWFDTEDPVLLDRASTEQKRDLMRFVQGEFRREAMERIEIVPRALAMDRLHDLVAGGARALVLVDQCHTHDQPAPHWVLVHAAGDGVFLLNDPWIETDDGETAVDTDCLPVRLEVMSRMAAYGHPPYRAAIVLPARRAEG